MPLGPDELVALARVARPVGVKGELRVEVLADRPLPVGVGHKVWLVGSAGRSQFRLWSIKQSGTHWASVGLEEISTRNDAEVWRGALLMVPRRELPPLPAGEYYDFDVEGLEARTPQGERLGTVTSVMHLPGNDVYAIRRPDGRELLVPAVRAVVHEINVAGGFMVVSPWPEWDDANAD